MYTHLIDRYPLNHIRSPIAMSFSRRRVKRLGDRVSLKASLVQQALSYGRSDIPRLPFLRRNSVKLNDAYDINHRKINPGRACFMIG